MWKCEHCQEAIEDEFDTCWNCGKDKEGNQVTPAAIVSDSRADARRVAPRDRTLSSGDASPEAAAIANRYDDAYAVADATVAHGSFVKAMAVALGIVIFVAGIALSVKSDNVVAGIVGALAGALFGGQMYFLGVLICAQGQSLTATLDTAVNSCEFLSRAERIKILGLDI